MAARLLGPASADPTDPGAALDTWLSVPEPHPVSERLRIYSGGYPSRIHDSLTETYAALARLLGESAFDTLTHRYATSVLLTSYNLNDAGAAMPAFLAHDALTIALPFLPDLAALEWHVARAFHAAERPPLDPRALSWTIDEWANAILLFQPSVAVLSSPWPLLNLWTARNTPSDAIDVELRDRPEHIVVRRAGYIVRCESVSAPEAFALRFLLGGHSLTETAERLEADGHDPTAVSAWFSRWIGADMIADAVGGSQPDPS
jgi:hypothetical protein